MESDYSLSCTYNTYTVAQANSCTCTHSHTLTWVKTQVCHSKPWGGSHYENIFNKKPNHILKTTIPSYNGHFKEANTGKALNVSYLALWQQRGWICHWHLHNTENAPRNRSHLCRCNSPHLCHGALCGKMLTLHYKLDKMTPLMDCSTLCIYGIIININQQCQNTNHLT